MNLEKEIQLFEDWCDIFGLPIDEVDGEYTDPRTTIAFLAWYEVVNRDGYKLVPVEPTEETIKSMLDAYEEHLSEGMLDAYKAMIGAVE